MKRPNRANITAEFYNLWVPDDTPSPPITTMGALPFETEAELLDAVGREGLEWHRTMLRQMSYGMLGESA